MRILIVLIILTLYSCRTQNRIVTTELNTVGKIIKIRACNDCIDGSFIYTIELDPEEHQTMKYISDCRYNIGDMLYFKTIIQKDTYE
jgi:hypothetical protein